MHAVPAYVVWWWMILIACTYRVHITVALRPGIVQGEKKGFDPYTYNGKIVVCINQVVVKAAYSSGSKKTICPGT
jgi:hypothetical protein